MISQAIGNPVVGCMKHAGRSLPTPALWNRFVILLFRRSLQSPEFKNLVIINLCMHTLINISEDSTGTLTQFSQNLCQISFCPLLQTLYQLNIIAPIQKK